MARRPEFLRTMFGETPEAPKPEKKQPERPRERRVVEIIQPEENPAVFIKNEMDEIDQELSTLESVRSKKVSEMAWGKGRSPEERKASAETRMAELESRRDRLVAGMQEFAKGNKEPIVTLISESLERTRERSSQATAEAETRAREIREQNPADAEQADLWIGEMMKYEGMIADAERSGRQDTILRAGRMLAAAAENYNDTEIGRAYLQANKLKKRVDDLMHLQATVSA